MSDQIKHWKFNTKYQNDNSEFNFALLEQAWSKIVPPEHLQNIKTVIELGSNIGRNLIALNRLLPDAYFSACDVSSPALQSLALALPQVQVFNSSIQDLEIPDESHDLVFTSGVLIHIHPNSLYEVLEKAFVLSRRYILFIEYFSDKTENVRYKDRDDLLWKSDFGKIFYANFAVRPLEEGFLWRERYGDAGFDDCVYWLFEKT